MNPDSRVFMDYGGRGIKVCERWDDFSLFLADMGTRPTPKHTIDRIDVNGDYEPGNCRWASRTEQQANKRNSRKITYQGETLCLAHWAKRFGISQGNFNYWYVDKGFTVDQVRERFANLQSKPA